ncbi:tryptophan--tRNA ligase [Buchnera aphidicola (Hormaphis cornu)]|nr:tryptophan--tRNA ligase [Buchnera aphidicola (Hormaphis cornu)]
MVLKSKKKVIFSAIQPTGNLTIANYVGTLMHWASFQKNYECFYCIADLHCLTNRHNVIDLKKNVLDTLAIYLASGIDPNQCSVFVQSHIYEHSQLFWILSCYASFGELSRMTQFKIKSAKDNNIGLFNYPLLMASDILLYQSDYVPIGRDQLQHLELTRHLAVRINTSYELMFTVPSAIISSRGGKVFALQAPLKKMSKSDINMNNSIFLLDTLEMIIKKIRKSTTDSEQPPKIYYDPINKPGISNLLNIYSILEDIEVSTLEKQFFGMNYQEFKCVVSDTVTKKLESFQKNYVLYRRDESYLKDIAYHGANKARDKAKQTLDTVMHYFNLR